MIDRRSVIAGLALAVSAARTAPAQQPGRAYRIGWLSTSSPRSEPYSVAFVERLRERGFTEGQNLVIEYRNAEGRLERLRELAAGLGQLPLDALLAFGSELTLVALKEATRDIPIVIVAADYDPVAAGHIASLARPGGRITGVSPLQSELPAKRVELLREMLPAAKTMAVLADASTRGQLEMSRATARRLGIALRVHEFQRAPYDYDAAFTDFTRAKCDALLALASGLFVPARRRIPELALRHRLPSMFNNELWPAAGGLMSYGVDFRNAWRRAADKTVVVLGGANPADVPVEQPDTVELVVNLATLKALGLTLPESIRARVTRVVG